MSAFNGILGRVGCLVCCHILQGWNVPLLFLESGCTAWCGRVAQRPLGLTSGSDTAGMCPHWLGDGPLSVLSAAGGSADPEPSSAAP